MALDKQKILSELGSVVNQLQSADCGCMGKLFTNSNQCNGAATLPSHGGRCASNSCRAPCGHGEPNSGNRHCMGCCNPPKLYADTYNYLNANLMQPVVKEVYDDLKSITPANTMMNNPMGAQMGLAAGRNYGNTGQGSNMMGQPGGGMGNMMGQSGGGMGNMMGQSGGGMGNMVGQSGTSGNTMQHGGNMMGQTAAFMMGQSGGGMNNAAYDQSGTGNALGQTQGGMTMSQSQSGGHGNMGGIESMMGNFGNNMFYNPGGTGNTSQNPGSGGNMMAGGMSNQNVVGNQDIMGTSNPDHANAHQYAMAQKMGGMGPQICNMMMGDSKSGAQKSSQPNAMGGNFQAVGQGDMSAYSSGQPGVNTYSPGNAGQNNQMYGSSTGQYQGGAGVPRHQNMQSGETVPQNAFPASPAHQQMTTTHNHGKYGQHSAGMAKFNEMFPGVMSGDLGFDPMAIAIQMNPNNQQQAAIDTMNKMMMGNKGGINRVTDVNNAGLLQPAMKGSNAAAASLEQSQAHQSGYQNQQQMGAVPPQSYQQMNVTAPQTYQIQTTGQQPPQSYQQQSYEPPSQGYQHPTAAYQQPSQQDQGYNQSNLAYQQSSQAYRQSDQEYKQPAQGYQQSGQGYQDTAQNYQQLNQGHEYQAQAYQQPGTAAVPPQQAYQTGTTNQLASPNEQRYQLQYGQTGPNSYEGSGEPTSQNYIKEPLYPADTANKPAFYAPSKPRKNYELNTLGQPVEMLPARIYQTPEPNLPQTLSPQQTPQRLRPDPMRYNNVKSTISKTALMGAKPVGNVPSRSQLQRVYNQYKGSQSFTQQNVRPAERMTHSAGSINVAPNVKLVPIERVGGDTTYNTMAERVPKVEHVIGRMGDVPTNGKPPKEKLMPITKQGRCRNGLQDMVFTSYQSSAAWSFHGQNQAPPFSTGYRFRNRA